MACFGVRLDRLQRQPELGQRLHAGGQGLRTAEKV